MSKSFLPCRPVGPPEPGAQRNALQRGKCPSQSPRPRCRDLRHGRRPRGRPAAAQPENHAELLPGPGRSPRATGNPQPGESGSQGPVKKLKIEATDEVKKRLAEFRAKAAARKAGGAPDNVAGAGNPPRDGESPDQPVRGHVSLFSLSLFLLSLFLSLSLSLSPSLLSLSLSLYANHAIFVFQTNPPFPPPQPPAAFDFPPQFAPPPGLLPSQYPPTYPQTALPPGLPSSCPRPTFPSPSGRRTR